MSALWPGFSTVSFSENPGAAPCHADHRNGKPDMAQRRGERERRMASMRRAVSASGTDRNFARHSTSQTEPAKTHVPRRMPSAILTPEPAKAAGGAPDQGNRRCSARAGGRLPPGRPRFQARNMPKGTASRSGMQIGTARRVEERRADGDFVAGEGFKRDRIVGADEHGAAAHRKQQVVQDESAFARNERKCAAAASELARHANIANAVPVTAAMIARI